MKVTTLDRMPPHALKRIAKLEALLETSQSAWLLSETENAEGAKRIAELEKVRDAAQKVLNREERIDSLAKVLEGNTNE